MRSQLQIIPDTQSPETAVQYLCSIHCSSVTLISMHQITITRKGDAL